MHETVLLVEDDPLLQDVLAQRVQKRGLLALTACDCNTALLLLPRSALAIVDLGLPPTPDLPDEGLRLLQMASTRAPEVPMIVVTGQDEAHVAHQAIACGAFDFLSKPLEPAAFDVAVERALRFVRARRRLADEGKTAVQLSASELTDGLRSAVDAAQEKLIRQVLTHCRYNVAEAARRLQIQRTQLYYYMDKFGIRRDASGVDT